MTKRMLSLLLALVMTLSLCVPALAADEFEAETVTEVEEQAPEAPVEPEAPEAEVVEEPVAEEPAEAPEAAAAIAVEEEPEDLPMLVALGVVSKDAHWKLYKAVQDAKELQADVTAGKLRAGDFAAVTIDDTLVTNYTKDKDEYDPFKTDTTEHTSSDPKSFAKTLEEAEKYLKGIDGAAVDLDVTTANVDAAATALLAYTDDLNHSTTALTDEVPTSVTVTAIQAFLAEAFTEKAYASVSDAKTALKIDWDGEDDVATDASWTKAYQANYLTALQKAIDAVEAYEDNLTPKYTDYKAVIYAILDALALEANASKPGDAEVTRVANAINSVPAQDQYNQADYVLGIPATATGATNIYNTSGTKGLLQDVKDLKEDPNTATVKFKSGETKWSVIDKVEKLENAMVKKSGTTIRLETKEAAPGTSITLVVSIEADSRFADTDKLAKGDGYTYYVAYQLTRDGTTKWFHTSGTGKDTFTEATKYGLFGSGVSGWSTKALGTAAEGLAGRVKLSASMPCRVGSAFVKGDVLTVHFYTSAGTDAYNEVGSGTVEIKEAVTSKPTAEIAKVEFKANDTVPAITKFTTSSKLISGSPSYTSGWSTEGYGKVTVTTVNNCTVPTGTSVIFRAKLSVGSKSATASITAGSKTCDISITEEIDKLLTAGTPGNVEVQYATNQAAGDAGAWTTIATDVLKVPSIKEWKTGTSSSEVAQVTNLQNILDAVGDLVKDDYYVSNYSKLEATTAAARLDEAFNLINDNAAKIKNIITSSTLGNTPTNHNAAAAALNDMLTVCGYLTKVTPEMNDFNVALAQAKPLVDTTVSGNDIGKQEGTGKYTFDSLGKLKDAYNTYSGISSNNLQSEVNAATKALKDAYNALVPLGEVDKTALQNSIAAAEAKLAEKDKYTEESVKALQDALTAAQAVLDKANPTQAELTNAAANLNAAVAALEEKPATKADLQAAVTAAEALKQADYTEATWTAFATALKAAQDVLAKADATETDYTAALKALKDAQGKLEKKTPAENPKDKWVADADGDYHYYDKNGVEAKGWVFSGSKHGLWYYCDPTTGKLVTGFKQVKDPKEPQYDGWYYFTPSGDCIGAVTSGWQNVPGYGWSWFETRHNGHWGACTYTASQGDYKNYQPTK